MKIAFVYDAVYPWVKGGVEKRVWELGRRLANEHEVHLYGFHYWDGRSIIERDGIVLHGVADPPANLYKNGRRVIPEAVTFASHVIGPLRKQRFDVIDCQEFPYFPCFSSKLSTIGRDTVMFVTWHEVWNNYWYDYLGYKGVLGKAIERMVMRLPNYHIAVSERTRGELEALNTEVSHVVPNGIDFEAIRKVPRAKRDIDLIFVGRFIEEKNLDLLLESVQEIKETHPQIRCFLVGDGPERPGLERRSELLGLEHNVKFTGTLDNDDDVLAMMKAADVFAAPSKREGFGLAALEALACGTPVVTIDHYQNATQDLVENGKTGYVCDSEPEAFARSLLSVSEDINPSTCLAKAEEYEWGRIVSQLEDTYRRYIP